MAPTFPDFAASQDTQLRLPINGKTYVIAPMSAKDGLWAQTMMDTMIRGMVAESADPDKPAPPATGVGKVLDDGQERDFYRTCLGAAYDEMLADDVPWVAIGRAAQTVYLYTTVGEEAAISRWTEAAPGKALRPSRSGAGRSTKKPASGSGTRTSRRRK